MSFVSLTDEISPRGTEVFLDTSIHCCRHKGPLFRPRVEAVLRRFRWIGTSSYAKVEFGNVVLANAQYYLDKLDALKSLAAVLDFVGNVLRQQSHRDKVTWSFNLLAHHEGSDDLEQTERAVCSLRLLMKVGVEHVEVPCDHVSDGTGCYWAKKGVQKRRDGKLRWQYPVCKRDHKRCRLDEFFTENRDLFIKIKDAIDNLPNERRTEQLSDFSKVIATALNDPTTLLDYKSGCKRLADAIIAVDSSSYGSMFTQNERESSILCSVLGQDLYYLPPNPERGVLLQSNPSPRP